MKNLKLTKITFFFLPKGILLLATKTSINDLNIILIFSKKENYSYQIKLNLPCQQAPTVNIVSSVPSISGNAKSSITLKLSSFVANN